ncbi:uncharacterized protein LALA0_S08e07272g [Lachancea lanzarotensis]|uniref:LALA0S08e07272g1_1 n=1 Tax=Lachancea lanzarotensis TaxID=1245769 RepID=A0A0C7N0H6_9SACH|nr:uncharacterized protein LALA0_S08e07272g [Lachancea lanzarotensis]CEP63641.1 LALA0S08e07272g1_1 [Lachancea lanzarotensis]
MDYKDTEEHLIETIEGSQSYSGDYGPLPRDTFKSKLSWELKFRKWSYVILLLTIIVYGLLVVVCFGIDKRAGVLFTVFGIFLFFVPLCAFASSSEIMWNHTTVRIWMVEIINTNPGDDLNKWDLIAAKMNTILYENDERATKYYFYDGKHCLFRFVNKCVAPSPDNSAACCPSLGPFVKAAADQYIEHFNEQLRQMTLGSSADRTEVATQNETV